MSAPVLKLTGIDYGSPPIYFRCDLIVSWSATRYTPAEASPSGFVDGSHIETMQKFPVTVRETVEEVARLFAEATA